MMPPDFHFWPLWTARRNGHGFHMTAQFLHLFRSRPEPRVSRHDFREFLVSVFVSLGDFSKQFRIRLLPLHHLIIRDELLPGLGQPDCMAELDGLVALAPLDQLRVLFENTED